jgi:type II secretory pathway component PulK
MENLMFDYRSLGDKLAVPSEIVQKFEQEALNEFPYDNMLMEIHAMRAIQAYAKTMIRMVPVEIIAPPELQIEAARQSGYMPFAFLQSI